MKIQKRDGSFQEFNGQKIATAIQKAFQSGDTEISPAILQEIVREITRQAEGRHFVRKLSPFGFCSQPE